MGTLIFHILLFLAFILAEVDMKGNVQEEELFIEFPDVLPEPEDLEQEEAEQEQQETEPAEQANMQSNQRSNQASNQMAETKNDKFFDEEYMQELDAAQKLRSDVQNQLSKKAIDMDDIEMPVETTEGMNPDSIKNKVYTGESNIVYYLENRYHLRLPIPVYLSQGGGTVVVDIVVDRQGNVIEAKPRQNKSIRDEQIFLYAQAAASRTVFNADTSAPEKQKGTIHYTFVAQ